MFKNTKKSAFTLAEIMVTLGLIGVISALTIPTLALNYRAKVLEEQYRSTFSDIRQIGSMVNYDHYDVGDYANKVTLTKWEEDFVSRLNGASQLTSSSSSGQITTAIRDYYSNSGATAGPFYFTQSAEGQREAVASHVCNDGDVWLDNKGRVWSFNSENRTICVDINGSANPNRYNMDIFAFIPMNSKQIATWVYNDSEHHTDYSGAIVACDIEQLARRGVGDVVPEMDENGRYTKGEGSALDYCPFNEPMENIAAVNSYSPGKSARNKDVDITKNYWKDYIEYK